MNTDKQPFEKAMHLFSLIQQNVQFVAEEIVAKYPEDNQHIDSAKLGAAEAWINRLCGMVCQKDRDYLLQLLQQQESKLETR